MNVLEHPGEIEAVNPMEKLEEDYYAKRVSWLEAVAAKQMAEQELYLISDSLIDGNADPALREDLARVRGEIRTTNEKLNRLGQEMDDAADAITFYGEDGERLHAAAMERIKEVHQRIDEQRPELGGLIKEKTSRAEV